MYSMKKLFQSPCVVDADGPFCDTIQVESLFSTTGLPLIMLKARETVFKNSTYVRFTTIRRGTTTVINCAFFSLCINKQLSLDMEVS